MRKFKRLTLTLALLIMAVGGAWAQGSLNVVEIVAPASWENDQSNVTAADLPGFNASTLEEAKAWTGAPAGLAMLIYAFDGDKICFVPFEEGAANSEDKITYTKDDFFFMKSMTKIYYTASDAIELTPDETGKTWTLAKMPASNIELQVEYEPTKVTMAANDNAMGTVEVAGQSIVEWTADTWKGWTVDDKEHTVDDITITSTQTESVYEYPYDGKYKNSLSFFVVKSDNSSTVTFSTTGDPFSRIEFTMISDYSQYNPSILPIDGWTIEGKSAVWEGEATKSLTLQSCSTSVSKITFYKSFAIPDGVTVNGDGTFTVAKTATVTLKATPAEGYKFLYWEDDQTNTNPVREVTIESGMADKTYKAVFAEILYNVTFVEGTNLDEWTATPNTEVKKDTKVDIKYTGTKKVIGVTVEKKEAAPTLNLTSPTVGQVIGSDGKNYNVAEVPTGVTKVAMIADVNGSNGLAIALADESSNMNWATAKSTCEAKTPAFTGGTWKLPTQDEWKNMFKAFGGNNAKYTGLNNALAAAGGNGSELQTGDSYWSSSEIDENKAYLLYLLSSDGDTDWYDDSDKNIPYRVRACLAF